MKRMENGEEKGGWGKKGDFGGGGGVGGEGGRAILQYLQYGSKYIKYRVIILFEGITTSSRITLSLKQE